LIHQHCPVSGLIGIVCHSETGKMNSQSQIDAIGLNLPIYVRPDWYF
jgi:hypothetical protein